MPLPWRLALYSGIIRPATAWMGLVQFVLAQMGAVLHNYGAIAFLLQNVLPYQPNVSIEADKLCAWASG
jgi:hypothetical protein